MKTQIMWAVKNKSGYMFAFNETRRDAIRKACDSFGMKSWEWAKRNYGMRVVKVEIKEMPPEKP